MEYSDRELLVYRIRSGVFTLKIRGKTIKIEPISIQGNLDACEEYRSVYDRCLAEGIPTQDEMVEWMIENDLWSYHDDKDMEKIKKGVEDLKLSCYENRRNQIAVNSYKNKLRGAERAYRKFNERKYKYFANTCDGIAAAAKNTFIVEENSMSDGERYNFKDVSLEYVCSEYTNFHNIEDDIIRYLSRTEPWRTIWSTRDNVSCPLFFNEPNIDLTINQKSLLGWSQMYDNVHESTECPDRYVIDDDDLLDGWFVQQTRKREKDKAKEDLEHSIKNSKIKNSQEVYSVVNNVEEFRKVDMLNNNHTKAIKRQRENLIKDKGGVGQGAFHDEKLKYVAQQNRQFKGKFGG